MLVRLAESPHRENLGSRLSGYFPNLISDFILGGQLKGLIQMDTIRKGPFYQQNFEDSFLAIKKKCSDLVACWELPCLVSEAVTPHG